MLTLYYARPFQTVFKIVTDCESIAHKLLLLYGRYIYTNYNNDDAVYNILELSRNVQSKVDPKSNISVIVSYSPRFDGVERSGTEEKRGGDAGGWQCETIMLPAYRLIV